MFFSTLFKITLVRLVQFLNAESPISFVVISKEIIPVLFSKAEAFISLTFKLTLVIFLLLISN